jgi:hypothetical protein
MNPPKNINDKVDKLDEMYSEMAKKLKKHTNTDKIKENLKKYKTDEEFIILIYLKYQNLI